MSPQTNRRQFLKASTALTAAPLLGGFFSETRTVHAADQVAPSDKIRVGLIGSGGMGRGDLATFLKNAEVDCPVIVDVDDAMSAEGAKMVAELRGKAPETLRDFRKVIDRRDVDAWLVATPDHWHALPTIHACQAGKDVYVEKPLATTIDEGRAMLEATKKHGRIVQMGTQWRSGTRWRQVVEFVQSGKLGRVGLVRGWAYHDWLATNLGHPPDGPAPASVDYDLWLGPAPKRAFNANRFHFNFRWFWDYAGGLMTDWGVHLINVMLWAMGPEHPKTVASTGGKFVLDDNTETPDTQITVYEFPSYTMMWEHKTGIANGLYNRPWGIAFVGSQGTLVCDDSGFEVLPEPKAKKPPEKVKLGGGGDSRPLHVKNFLECMKTRQQPVENLELAHHVSAVAHLGNIAVRSGAKIVWDPVAEKITNDKTADALVGVEYRAPWKLPYSRRI